ncbi:hypothetical protein DFQ26_005702, partial [Actinomortierella ambigua]
NKFALLDETNPFQESLLSTQPNAIVDDRFRLENFVDMVDNHSRLPSAVARTMMTPTFTTATLSESDDSTPDTDSWHVQESRKKRPSRNEDEDTANNNTAAVTIPAPARTPQALEPWDQDDEDAYYYSCAYGDEGNLDHDTHSSFYSGSYGGDGSIDRATSPSSSTLAIITSTHEHELSKSPRAVNRKNIRLATKHQRKVKEIRTNQKNRADNIENRERRKNPPPEVAPPLK